MTTEHAIKQYRNILTQMEFGDLSEFAKFAEHLREFSSNREIEILRRLLVVRLSCKQTSSGEQLENFLSVQLTGNSFIDAEILFVRGLQYFHVENFNAGAKSFSKAAELYFQIAWTDKAILSLFNELMGQLNDSTISDSAEEARLTYLERLAHHHESTKMLGLILRHKALFLEKASKFQGAEIVLKEALSLLQKQSALSDYQLGVLQLCYLLSKNGKISEAKQNYESLIGPFDTRLEFAHAFIYGILFEKPSPSVDNYDIVPPVWRDRAMDSESSMKTTASDQSLVWRMDEGVLLTASGEASVRRDSIEGRLLQILLKGRRSRADLCSLLWPEQADSSQVIDRLSKVIARLRAKDPQIIKFENNSYFLGTKILKQ